MMQGDFGDEEIAPATKGVGFGSPAVRWGYPSGARPQLDPCNAIAPPVVSIASRKRP